MKQLMLKNLIFLFMMFNLDQAYAISSLDCLKQIMQDQDFSNNPHHPEKYFFARSEKQLTDFYLISDQQNYLCKASSIIESDSTLEINTPLTGVKSPVLVYYSKLKSTKEKPQTKNSNVPSIDGFLPAHQIIESATDIATISGKKNSVQCNATSDQELIKQLASKLARLEVQDLYADFAESRDGMAYNYDVKEKQKALLRRDYDMKLKKVLDFCQQAPELKSVSEMIAAKIQLKSDVDFHVVNSTSSSKVGKKEKLPAGAKQ